MVAKTSKNIIAKILKFPICVSLFFLHWIFLCLAFVICCLVLFLPFALVLILGRFNIINSMEVLVTAYIVGLLEGGIIVYWRKKIHRLWDMLASVPDFTEKLGDRFGCFENDKF